MKHEHESEPCPFCGWEESSLSDIGLDDGKLFQVGCDDCLAWGPEAESADEAWRLWNKRAA